MFSCFPLQAGLEVDFKRKNKNKQTEGKLRA